MPLESLVRAGLQQQIGRLAIMLVAISLAGTVGYMVLEDWGFIESLYMTVITLSTVGFGEVHELSTNGRLFTTIMIVAGVGIVAYSFGTIGHYLISGELRGTLRRHRMQQQIDRLKQHVIVCGFGRVGQRVTLDLELLGQVCLVIDSDAERLRNDPDRLALISDASDDDELTHAGIERARGLIAATGDDATNTFITLTARALRPDLSIVARANHSSTEAKLLKAGANHVISPSVIAGHRMAIQLLHPSVVDFLDVVTHAGAEEMWLEEIVVRDGAELAGKSLVDSNVSRRIGVNVLALRQKGRSSVVSAAIADTPLEAGDALIALGTRDQLKGLRELA